MTKEIDLVSQGLQMLGKGDKHLGRALRSNVRGGGKFPALPI